MGSHQQRDRWKLIPSSAWVGPERQYISSRLWSHLSEALVQLLKFLHLQWPATWACWSLLIKEPLTQAPGSVVIVGAVPGLLDVPWVTITVYEILWTRIAPSLLEQHCCFPCPLELKLAEDALPLSGPPVPTACSCDSSSAGTSVKPSFCSQSSLLWLLTWQRLSAHLWGFLSQRAARFSERKVLVDLKRTWMPESSGN